MEDSKFIADGGGYLCFRNSVVVGDFSKVEPSLSYSGWGIGEEREVESCAIERVGGRSFENATFEESLEDLRNLAEGGKVYVVKRMEADISVASLPKVDRMGTVVGTGPNGETVEAMALSNGSRLSLGPF